MAGRKNAKTKTGGDGKAPKSSAMAVALRLLSYRARSVKEVRDKLSGKGFGVAEITGTVERLIGYGYLDDGKFASAFARSRMIQRHWGPARIAAELRRKGVDPEIIREALPAPSDEAESIKTAFRKWLKRTGSTLPLDIKASSRAWRHLVGLGYPGEAVRRVLNVSAEADALDE